VLGRLACLVLSKILGIGTAERNWKQVKKAKKGDRAKTGVEKTTKQVLIFSQHQMMRGALRRTALSAAGKLGNDTDFASMKMDEYCKDLEAKVGDVDEPMTPTRVVRLWKERWEVPKQLGGEGHVQLLARMERKYVGLKLDEMEKGWNIYTVDQVLFDGCRLGNKRNDVCAHCGVLQKSIRTKWRRSYAMMTVTVMNRGMNGNGLVRGKRG